MRQIYEITDTVRNSISSNGITNKVTFGDLLQVDLDKTTMFPLAHITIGTSVFSDYTITIPLNILFIDIVDVNKSEADFDDFYGNDNLQDVLNTQFEVGNRLVTLLRRGDLFANHYQVTTDATLTPFIERFSNVLAGYELEVTIEMKNDISIC